MSTAIGRVGRNFTILAVSQVASRLLAFAVTIYLTRTLLPGRFGAVAFATSLLPCAGLLVDFGFDSLGPLEVARSWKAGTLLARIVVRWRLTMLLPAGALLAAFAFAAPIEPLTRTVLLLYGLSLLANALDLNWYFLGRGHMRPVALADLGCQALITAASLLLVNTPEHVLRVPVIFFGARMLTVLWLALQFRRERDSAPADSARPALRPLLHQSLPFLGSAAIGVLRQYFDLILVGVWLGSEAAGIYGAAYRFVWVPILFMGAYLTALRPTMVQTAQRGEEDLRHLMRRVMPPVAAFGGGVTVGGVILANPLIALVFGEAYRGAVVPFQLLLVAFLVMTLSRPFRLLLVANHGVDVDLRIMAVSAAVNVLANLALVPTLGLAGAATTNVISEVLILVLTFFAVRSTAMKSFPVETAIKLLACLVVMTAVLLLGSNVPTLPRAALGAACYVAMLFASRTVKLEDLSDVR